MNSAPTQSLAYWLVAASTAVFACSLQMPRESEIFSSAGAGASVGGGGADAQAGGAAGATGGRGGASGSSADSGPATGGAVGTGGAGMGGSVSDGGGTGGNSGDGMDDDGGAGGTAGDGGPSFDPEVGLVAHYPFDETSGVVAANSKDATKNATYFGSCGHPNGRYGKAVSMRNSATMDWVELPAGLFSDLSAMTFVLWVRDLSVDRKGGRAIDFGSGSPDNFYFVPDQVNPATSLVAAELGGTHTSLGFVDLWTPSTVSLTDKVWHQVAISWSAQSIDLYVDAMPMASKTNPGVIPSDLGVTMPNWLGRSFNDVYPALYAEMDDLRIYDRPLSADEISALYGIP